MKTTKLTYSDIQTKDILLSALPLKEGDKELPSAIKTKAVLMGVELLNLTERFQKDSTEIIKKLKPEGFDERARKMERLKEIESFKEPLSDDLKEAAIIRKLKPAFEKEQQCLVEEYNAAITSKLSEEVEIKSPGFTQDEMQTIIETLSSGDDIEINGNKIPRLRYLVMFAQNMIG